jgi:hypothetical protein
VEEVLAEDPLPLECRYALVALCLVDDPSEVQRRARLSERALQAESGCGGSLFGKAACVTYFAELDEKEFLKKANGGSFSMCMAHFTIAMARLAAKDREGASEHFRRAVDTNAIGSYDYELARAYLDRMENED